MRTRRGIIPSICLVLGIAAMAYAALVVPNEIQQPGTQPGQVGNLESPDKCDNCHGGYNAAVEPAYNWRGSMMANAGRDPIFWATMAIAEQDFDGAGDLCIRCHSTSGWYAGRSTPTNGSALAAGDADGVECDACHKMTNTDQSEHAGVMVSPFIANDKKTPATGYHGTGMLALSGGAAKLGPYSNADARHQFAQSKFHRSVDFCGSCHDVSNPAVGDLAPNNGKQATADPVVASGVPGSALTSKAAFNNFPFMYGIVERTFSEFKSGALSKTPVSTYADLPSELKGGAVKMAYDAALAAGKGGNYEDGTVRYFSCQSCHVRPTTGQGCNKNGALVRKDLPLHDMTGGNVWIPDAILYQNQQGTLRLGGGLTATQIGALNAGKQRSLQQLRMAAQLSVNGNTLKITNLTGHKLISGYPEGRRMWLNVVWYDSAGSILREDGRYGFLPDPSNPLQFVTANGVPVKSIVDLDDPNTKVYEAHYGLTQEWAKKLLLVGLPEGLPLAYDRYTGAVTETLGGLAEEPPGAVCESFHFVLNNTVKKDNRIPPYGMTYEAARVHNALPVPATQYGRPGPSGTYNHWDEITLNPPSGARYADVRLMYQSTSWEYIQFLNLANNRSIPFLANEGANLLSAWLATGMAEPIAMASTTWGSAPTPSVKAPGTPTNLTATGAKKAVSLAWTASNPAPTSGGYRLYYEQAGKLLFRAAIAKTATAYKDTGLTSRTSYTYVLTAWNDANGNGVFDAGIDPESEPSNKAAATAQ